MLTVYEAAHPEFVNTSEAYSKSIFIGKENVVVPYINIGLMPANPINGRQSIVDYSYYVLLGVRMMDFGFSERRLLSISLLTGTNQDLLTEYISIGGYSPTQGAEVKIQCVGLRYYISNNATFRTPLDFFMPLDTPLGKRNLASEDVELFFTTDNLPTELKQVLGDCFWTMTC